MRTVFFSVSLILLLVISYMVICNMGGVIEINYMLLGGGKHISSMSFTLFSLFILGCGLFVGSGIVYLFLSEQKAQNKAFQRELERRSITGEENASKVEVLEAKIRTLEKAFNSVIDERTKLEVQIHALNDELEKMNKNR